MWRTTNGKLKIMKIMRGIAVAAAAALFVTSSPIFGIEGLQIAVPCPDVLLSWPSVEGETYIVQYRQTLDANSTWITLTNALPAETGTNWTFFVHSNQMVCSTNSGGGGGGGGSAPPSPMSVQQQTVAELDGTAFPIGAVARQYLAKWHVHPPYSWDLEHRPPFLWELEARPPLPWEEGATKPPTKRMGIVSGDGSGIELDGPLDSGGETNVTGFYRVVRVGAHLFGITNGMVLSGTVPLPIEFGNPDSNQTLAAVFLTENGSDATVPGARFPDLEDDAWAGIIGEWNTTLTTNGQYTLQLGCRLLGDVVYGTRR